MFRFYIKQIFWNFPFLGQLFVIRAVMFLGFCHSCRASAQYVAVKLCFYSIGEERGRCILGYFFQVEVCVVKFTSNPSSRYVLRRCYVIFMFQVLLVLRPCKYFALFPQGLDASSASHEEPSLLGWQALSFGEYFPTFRKLRVPSFSGLCSVALIRFN